MDLKETYNQIAEDWCKDHGGDDWWKEEADKLLSLLPQGARILDIGCGPGQKTRYFYEKGFAAIGGDLSEKMVEIAKQQVPEASFKVLDLYTLSSLDEKFDCIFAQAVLLHIPKKDMSQILENIKHVLKPGGFFYLAVKEAWPGTPEEEILEENDYGYSYSRFFSYFTPPELTNLLQNAKYTIVDSTVTKVGKTNWIQIISKI